MPPISPVTLVPRGGEGATGFLSPEYLADQARQMLAKAPPDKHVALVAVADHTGTIEFHGAAKIGDTWEVGGVFSKKKGEPAKYGVRVGIYF